MKTRPSFDGRVFRIHKDAYYGGMNVVANLSGLHPDRRRGALAMSVDLPLCFGGMWEEFYTPTVAVRRSGVPDAGGKFGRRIAKKLTKYDLTPCLIAEVNSGRRIAG